MTFVCKPAGKDKDGNDLTSVMGCTNVDINGFVPKWIVNLVARSAPT